MNLNIYTYSAVQTPPKPGLVLTGTGSFPTEWGPMGGAQVIATDGHKTCEEFNYRWTKSSVQHTYSYTF